MDNRNRSYYNIRTTSARICSSLPEKLLQRQIATDIGPTMARWLSCLVIMLSVLACDIVGSPLLANPAVEAAGLAQVVSEGNSHDSEESGQSHSGVAGHMAHGHCTANLADPADMSQPLYFKMGRPCLPERQTGLNSWSTAPPTQPPSA